MKAKNTVLVCQGTGCTSGKSPRVRARLATEIARAGLQDFQVDFTGCHGFCQQGPIVVVEPAGIFYTHVQEEDAVEIVRSHFIQKKPVERLFYRHPQTGQPIPYYRDIPFYQKQKRLILRNCGHINPERIADYLAAGGYEGLKRVLKRMRPDEVIEEIKRSGLRGRGGAGFPTGLKWEFCRQAAGTPKYVICNADEGDPGAFMDRSILEADPHAVIEGIAIAAYAIGASEGYIYVRAEYPLAVHRVKIALQQAEESGFLGENILNTGFSFRLHVMEGAGAFVCGEETALMASIEGKRGMPRPRPPFPAQSGLWGRPTNINNVKTYASVPLIIRHGARWYADIGTEKSKGTAVFALSGKIANCGLVEVPMGTTLQEIIFDIGGGVPKGKKLKAVQTGGPSGGCLPARLVHLPVDYESLAEAGSIMGSGGMVVMDEDTCMVDMARYFLSFTQDESCGKCVPCRLGTRQMLEILEDVTHGRGQPEDLTLLEELCTTIKNTSLCGLGQTSPNPVLAVIRYFRDEIMEHIERQHCQAAVCRGLVKSPCSHTCPAGVNVPRYIRLAQRKKYGEAAAVIREKLPFPSICGLVCFHPCESKCRRGQLDAPVAIRALKRFVAEHDTGVWRQYSRVSPPTGKRVAVVGSGPAGLTAAYYLAKLGHQVTVFEALPEPGGMMRVGIPAYRLPREVLRQEIAEIARIGVEIKTCTPVTSLETLWQAGYDAIFLAVGAHRGLRLNVEGEDDPRVVECVEFLRQVNLGQHPEVGKRVVVVGGGNAAMDAARTALRLGAESVRVIYRRSREEMPAADEEIEEAQREGVTFTYLAAPLAITRDTSLQVLCTRMALGEMDASGRRRPEPVKGSEFYLEAEQVIVAIGQQPEIPPGWGLSLSQQGTIPVDELTMATDLPGVFAGGDTVTGPASVIEAIAAGRRAAVSIDRYLGGSGVIDEVLAPPEEPLPGTGEVAEEEGRRVVVPLLPVSKRRRSFAQVELPLTEEQVVEECQRCLRCDLEG